VLVSAKLVYLIWSAGLADLFSQLPIGCFGRTFAATSLPKCLGVAMYPTSEEKAIIDDAEKLMVETMARYDPSHDAFHG
jgi:hypothetical protein